jgi:pimeloyl-ACP methyl ester carboxylesterase
MGEIRLALRLCRVMKKGVVFNLLYFLLVGSSFGTEELPRIGLLGARISASGKSGEGATIRRIIDGSEAQRIGLTANDKILTLNGRAIDTDLDVENFFYRQPANAKISLTILRDAKRVNLEATLPPLPRENFAGIEYTYDYIRNNKGQRLRTIVTRPAGAAEKVPGIFVVGWLSCDSCEYPLGPGSGMDQLLAYLVKDSGFAVVRMDKPGVGDSEGVCAEADFKSEISGFEAAFKSIEKYPFIDPDRIAVVGMSNGGGFAPVAAPAARVKGFVAIGSWGRTWYEHMLAIERQSRIANGVEPAKINSDLKKIIDFYRLYLIEKETPKQILAAHSQWKGIWDDGEVTQYGRPAAFYQQLQDLNLGEVWAAVKVPVLVVRGEYDWIMPREDGYAIVESVNKSGPLAKYIELPRTTHGLSQFESLTATTKSGRGEYFKPVEATVTEFLKGVLK